MTTKESGAGIELVSALPEPAGRRAAGPPPARPRLAHLAGEHLDGALDGCQQVVGTRLAGEAPAARTGDESDRLLESLGGAGDAHRERPRPAPRELLDLSLDQRPERRRQHHPAPADDELHRGPPLIARSLRSPLPRREPALVRGQDAELLAVLGDRAPGDRETALLQRLRDLLVGLRLRRVLRRQEVLDHLLDRDRRYHLAVAGRDPAVEEEL